MEVLTDFTLHYTTAASIGVFSSKAVLLKSLTVIHYHQSQFTPLLMLLYIPQVGPNRSLGDILTLLQL